MCVSIHFILYQDIGCRQCWCQKNGQFFNIWDKVRDSKKKILPHKSFDGLISCRKIYFSCRGLCLGDYKLKSKNGVFRSFSKTKLELNFKLDYGQQNEVVWFHLASSWSKMYRLRGREKLTKLLSCGILNFFLIIQFDSFYNIFKNSGKISRIKGIFLIIWAYVSFVNFSFFRNPTFLKDSK